MFLLVLLAGQFVGRAAPPAGYYDTARGMAGPELRDALHAIIRSHHVIPYSSTAFDISDILKVLDQDPGHLFWILAGKDPDLGSVEVPVKGPGEFPGRSVGAFGLC